MKYFRYQCKLCKNFWTNKRPGKEVYSVRCLADGPLTDTEKECELFEEKIRKDKVQ